MKKGSYGYGYKVLFIIASLLLIVFMFGYFRGMYYDIQTDSIVCSEEMENFLMVAETIFSENCFVHSDDNRVYPGTIDLNKFTQERLDNCYSNIDRRISLTINDQTIGDELFSPVSITKPIQLYNNGETTISTVTIQVEEVVC
tara:strand:- start:1543 stop:1971 length:429 start_codon:yes stop_codon:yes gene_type:complete